MSALEARVERGPEPALRPSDRRWKWNGLFWENDAPGGRLAVHIQSSGLYSASVRNYSDELDAAMHAYAVSDIEVAAAMAHRMADYVMHLTTEWQTQLVIPRGLAARKGPDHVGRG